MPHDKENPLHFGSGCDEFPMADRRVPRFQTESIPEAEWNRRLERIAKEETAGDYPVEHYENVKDMADVVARQNARQADAKAGDNFIVTEVGSTPWATAMLLAGHEVRNTQWHGSMKDSVWYWDRDFKALMWRHPVEGGGPVSSGNMLWLHRIDEHGWEIVEREAKPETFVDILESLIPAEIKAHLRKKGAKYCAVIMFFTDQDGALCVEFQDKKRYRLHKDGDTLIPV